MTLTHTAALKLLVACALLQAPSAHSQADWEPMNGVLQMVSWFTKLSEQMDEVIAVEKRAQLLRAIDRLRKDLYTLEGNAQVLRDSVPENAPSAEERQYLWQQSSELLQVVQNLSESVRAVGAELRLNESEAIEYTLTSGLRVRGQALTEFQYALESARSGDWNPNQIRARLDTGIEAVKAAQLAATKFRREAETRK